MREFVFNTNNSVVIKCTSSYTARTLSLNLTMVLSGTTTTPAINTTTAVRSSRAKEEDRQDTSATVERRGSPPQKTMQNPARVDGSRWKTMYNNEAGSDVTFLVGEPECWRFPAHTDVLCQYPVFDAMLREPWSKKGTPIHIRDDDPRAFDNLLKFMYHNAVELKSVMTALETLGLANKYMCVDLVDECIVYLTCNLTVDTVLMVYRAARLYGGQTTEGPRRDRPAAVAASTSTVAPAAGGAWATAPPLQDLMPPAAAAATADDAHAEAFARMIRHHDALLASCGAFVDRNADRVMADETVDELDAAELGELLRRDTLAVSNELVLFATLERWCTHKCKQQHLELTVANRRAVLDDAVLLSVRYLQMTANEFLSGPMPSGLFCAQETAVLMKHILNPRHPKWTCRRITDEALRYMAVPRTKPAAAAASATASATGSGAGLSYVIRRRSSSLKGGGTGSRRSSSEFNGSPVRRSWCCSSGKKAKSKGVEAFTYDSVVGFRTFPRSRRRCPDVSACLRVSTTP